MEEVYQKLLESHVALFSDNSPTIGWVKRLAARGSFLAMKLLIPQNGKQLVQAQASAQA